MSPKLRRTKVALLHPKLCGQKLRGPKLWGNILKANMRHAVLYHSTLAPQSFGWSNATPQSFEDIGSAKKIPTIHIWKLNFISYFKVIFVNLWPFRDLDKQYDQFLRKIILRDITFNRFGSNKWSMPTLLFFFIKSTSEVSLLQNPIKHNWTCKGPGWILLQVGDGPISGVLFSLCHWRTWLFSSDWSHHRKYHFILSQCCSWKLSWFFDNF